MGFSTKTVYKYLLFAYALLSSVFLGSLVGFLVIYPFLQILLDSFAYDKSEWVNYSVYFIVALSISFFFYINIKRYSKQVRKRGLA